MRRLDRAVRRGSCRRQGGSESRTRSQLRRRQGPRVPMRQQRRSNAEGARAAARDGRPTTLSVKSSLVSSERLRRRSRPEATIAGEMLKQTALDFVGEPVIGTEMSAEHAGDFALGGALPRALDGALDGIDDATQQAAPGRGGLAAGAMRQFAGHAEITKKRNAIHGWVLSLLLRYPHPYNRFITNLMLVNISYKGYVLIQ